MANAGIDWTSSQTGLLSLSLIGTASTIDAQVDVTVPIELTLSNGVGAISDPAATVVVSVGRPPGINIAVGRARGFGVASFNNTASTADERTATYQTQPIIGQYGFPLTTFTRVMPINVSSGSQLVLPVQFGLAGVSTGVSISLLASFPVSVIVTFTGGHSITASTTISVPVGAGVL